VLATIGFVRHGLTDWNAQGRAQGLSDIPLNAEGRQQAKLLAERLKNGPWEAIVTSTLTRARETAEIIAHELGVRDVIQEHCIREIDCGLIEGTTEEQRIQTWGQQWRDLDLGMEPYEAVAARGVRFVHDISNKLHNQFILAVSHGAVIGLTLQQLMPHRFTTTYMDNASLTVITQVGDHWECSLYNDIRHLQKDSIGAYAYEPTNRNEVSP